MPSYGNLSNYPPGVTGNEPQITGEPDGPQADEPLYLVHICGEAFDTTPDGVQAAFYHVEYCKYSIGIGDPEPELFKLVTEEEAF